MQRIKTALKKGYSIEGILLLNILLFVLRTAIPYLLYLFIPVQLITLAILINPLLLNLKNKKNKEWLHFLFVFSAPLIFILFFVFYAIFYLDLSIVVSDLLSLLFILEVTIISFLLISYDALRKLIHDFHVILIYVALSISVFGLLKFFTQLFFPHLSALDVLFHGAIGTSLTPDNNFFASIIIVGLVSFIVFLYKNESFYLKKHKLVYLFLTISSIVLSFSRRAIVILFLLFMFFIVWYAILYFFKRDVFLSIRKRLSFIFRLLFGIIIVVFLLFQGIKNIPKDKIYKLLSQHELIERMNSSNLLPKLYKYSTIIQPQISYEEFYEFVWQMDYDANFPLSWCSDCYPLTKTDPKPGEIDFEYALVINETSNHFTWAGDYYYKRTINSFLTDNNDFIGGKIDCYVPVCFEKGYVKLQVRGKNGVNSERFYDLSNKGKWQQLNVGCFTGEGPQKIILEVVAIDTVLCGGVLFTNPTIEKKKVNLEMPSSGWGIYPENVVTEQEINNVSFVGEAYRINKNSQTNNWSNNAYSFIGINYHKNLGNSILSSQVQCYVSSDFTGSWVALQANKSITGIALDEYDLSRKGTWQTLNIEFTNNIDYLTANLIVENNVSIDFKNLEGYVLWLSPRVEFHHMEIDKQNKKKLEGSISKEDIDDAEKLKTNSQNENWRESNLLKSRLLRWSWAVDYYRKYSLKEKILGNGFQYIASMSKDFYGDKSNNEYPHNPLLSTLLYSGVVGFIVYLVFLGLSLLIYVRNFSEFSICLLNYFILFIFIFFSGNSHFSVPIYTFYSFLPFLIQYYRRNEYYSDSKK